MDDFCNIYNIKFSTISDDPIYQGGLNEKEIQLSLCNIFSVLIFIEFYLLA